jgi:hypothetical protein
VLKKYLTILEQKESSKTTSINHIYVDFSVVYVYFDWDFALNKYSLRVLTYIYSLQSPILNDNSK